MSDAGIYTFAPRALRRWRDERLTLHEDPDGRVIAEFRFDGSTCGNVPMRLRYHVELSPASDDRRILRLSCMPEVGDEGHQRMCSYLADPEHLMRQLEREAPLQGHPLREVLQWNPAVSVAGCLCTEAARNHKWLAVLHTIHWALTERTSGQSS